MIGPVVLRSKTNPVVLRSKTNIVLRSKSNNAQTNGESRMKYYLALALQTSFSQAVNKCCVFANQGSGLVDPGRN